MTELTYDESAASASILRGVRVLVLFGGSHLFGQERANIEVIRTLRTMGAEARFITKSRHGCEQIEPELKRWGFSWARAPFGFNWSRYMLGRHFVYFLRNLWGVVGTSWRLLGETWSWKPTHLYTMNWSYFLLALPAIRWLRLPLVFRAGDTLPQHTRFHRWIGSQLRKHVSLLVCNSQFVASSFSEIGFAPLVIYNHAPSRLVDSREFQIGQIEGATMVAYVGQIAEHKGVALLVETVITLLQSGRNLMLLIAGDAVWGDSLRERLEKTVADNGFTDRIRFVGWIEDVRGILCSADIHVCPSTWEDPSPNVIVEAKREGVPSVAFPVGGIPELIEHKVNGYLCLDSTKEALIEGLDYFIQDSNVRQAAGRAARASFEADFGFARFQRQWMGVLLREMPHVDPS